MILMEYLYSSCILLENVIRIKMIITMIIYFINKNIDKIGKKKEINNILLTISIRNKYFFKEK